MATDASGAPPGDDLGAEELAAIEARAARATVGPWADLEQLYWRRMQEYQRRKRRWWHGTRAWSLPVVLIASLVDTQGRAVEADKIPERQDWHDLRVVIGWRWGMLPRGRSAIMEGFLRPEDAAFIAHARSDVPRLVAALRAAWTARDHHPGGP